MKAKEYLEKFNADCSGAGDKVAVDRLIKGFFGEVYDLAKVRGVQSEEGVKSVLRELNQKWNAMCRLDEPNKRFKPNGFIAVIKSRIEKDAPQFIKVANAVAKEIELE